VLSLVICILSLEKCVFKSFAYFLNRIVFLEVMKVFWNWIFMRVVQSCEYIKSTELCTMKVNFMVHELYINFLSGVNSVYFLVLGKKY